MPSSSTQWWLGIAKGTIKRRLSREARLEELGISEEEFSLYKDLFLKHRQPNRYAIRTEDGGWPQLKHPWQDNLILRHLCCNTVVAIPFAEQVDQIVLDIDNHGNREWIDVEKTVHQSAQAIPGEPIIYRSSKSEGVRMIWFLKKALSRPGLCEWTKKTLQEAGVEVALGKCEVRLGQEVDRLPFGCGSMLLDSVTLEPLYDLNLSKTLAKVSEHRDNHSIDPPTILAESADQQRTRYDQVMTACLNGGLPPDITTNECLMKLAWYGRRRLGLEKDELKVYLQNWITNNHNGNSERINKCKINVVYGQINRIVDNLQAESGRRTRRIMDVPLSRSEILRVLDFPVGFKTLGGLYRLLRFSKAKLLHELESERVSRKKKREKGKLGTNKWGRVFNENEGIPNGAGFFPLYIDLSKRLLRLLKVPNADNTSRFVTDIERLGVIKHKRHPWPDGGKAHQYWINFPFDLEDELIEGDFDQVLWEIKGFDGIRKRFSKHLAKRIAWKIDNQNRKEPDE